MIVITDEKFKFALVTTSTNRDAVFAHMNLEDIAWLDYDRIHKETLVVSKITESLNPDVRVGMKRKREIEQEERQPGFPEYGFSFHLIYATYHLSVVLVSKHKCYENYTAIAGTILHLYLFR